MSIRSQYDFSKYENQLAYTTKVIDLYHLFSNMTIADKHTIMSGYESLKQPPNLISKKEHNEKTV